MVENHFARTLAILKDFEPPFSARRYDLLGSVLNRRKLTALDMLPPLQVQYGRSYVRLQSLNEDFIRLCGAAGYSLQDLEEKYYLSAAAACRMLDELKQADVLEEVRPYLPVPGPDFEKECLPENWRDPSYDLSWISGLTYLIQHRNQDHPNWYLNSVSVKRTHPSPDRKPSKDPAEMNGKERFRAVFRQIPWERKEQAAWIFTRKFWDFMTLYFRLCSGHSNRMAKLCGQLKREVPRQIRNLPPSPEPFYSFQPILDDILFFDGECPPLVRKKKFERLNGQALEASAEEKHLFNLANFIPMILNPGEDPVPNGLSQSELSAIRSFTVDDPFEICFGYLCDLEIGDDPPWAYCAAECLLLAACGKLPWEPSEKALIFPYEVLE